MIDCGAISAPFLSLVPTALLAFAGGYRLEPGGEAVHPLPGLEPAALTEVAVSFETLAELDASAALDVVVSDASGPVARKTLHAGDPDLVVLLRPRVAGAGRVALAARGERALPEASVAARAVELAGEAATGVVVAAQPNGTWRDAQSVPLGATVFGLADERPYVPPAGADAAAALAAGIQWFRVAHESEEPVLAHFALDVLDRDVPSDVDVFVANAAGTDVVPYAGGDDPYRVEATQSLPGFQRFRTRVLRKGTYFLRVAANHPAFTLRTSLYPVPPYSDPRQAVRTATDYLLQRGDAWHMNTPRRGGVALRTAQPHVETSLCIACHPTQFPARAALAAAENGYPVRQRASLSFLMERIRENARPLYGAPGANWVRVIYSARTVASRLPLLADAYERLVARDAPAPGFAEGYGAFLRMHYASAASLPGEEVDGCAPNVSLFEIAYQSFETARLLARRTGDEAFTDLAESVARMTPDAPANTVIDAAWKIVALAAIDRAAHGARIEALVRDLYRFQRRDGRWGLALSDAGPPSDFITFHVAWALAFAGRRAETDARLAKTARLILSSQLPSGGFRGDPAYKGFDTPFRDTQFAVMALSALYPGPGGGTTWAAGFPPPPETAPAGAADAFLAAADAFWDPPGEAALASLRRALAGDGRGVAIVRAAAAAALGRVADAGSVPDLAAALADPSKAVRREAARALREIATRRAAGSGAAADAILAALESPSDRARWGASRVFNQHFRALALARPDLLRGVAKALADPVVAVRLHAASGLWRFWVWLSDREEARAAILDALVARLGAPEHPWVRRALIEALGNVLDENLGYLEAWIRAAGEEASRAAIRAGHAEVELDQARRLAAGLASGDALRRDGILTAISDFHLRHAALPRTHGYEVELPAVNIEFVAGLPDLHREGFDYPPYREAARFAYGPLNTITKTRVGNDSDLVRFGPGASAALEEAIVDCLGDADPGIRASALKAATTLGDGTGEALVRAVLERTLDPDPSVRATARALFEDGVRGRLRLDAASAPAAETVTLLARVLESGRPESLAVALPLLAAAPEGSALARDGALEAAVRPLVLAEGGPSEKAIAAAAAFPSLVESKPVREAILRAVGSPDRETRRAALRASVAKLLDRPDAAGACQEALSKLDAPGRLVLLEEMARDAALFSRPALAGAFIDCLGDRDAAVRAAAADLLSQRAELRDVPAVRLALEALRSDDNERVRQIALSLLAGTDPGSALAGRDVASLFDLGFFRDRVQPVFADVGPDGNACVTCHASHAILRLVPPGDDGRFSEEATRANYFSALKVVDAAAPERSLLLVKPTRPAEAFGDVNDYASAHAGGRRWDGDERSAEYAAILAWLRGGK